MCLAVLEAPLRVGTRGVCPGYASRHCDAQHAAAAGLAQWLTLPYAYRCLALLKNGTPAVAIGYQHVMAALPSFTVTGLVWEGLGLPGVFYLLLCFSLNCTVLYLISWQN